MDNFNSVRRKALAQSFLWSLVPTLIIGLSLLGIRTISQSNEKTFDENDLIIGVVIYLLSTGLIFMNKLLFEIYSSLDFFNIRLNKIAEVSELKFSNLVLEAHVNEISNRISQKKRKGILKKALQDILKNNVFKIDIDKRGNFKVVGEAAALEAYYLLWINILEKQKKYFRSNKISKDKYLIARITHSNNPEIWDPSKNPFAEDLLSIQKEFIKFEGKILRFFVTNSSTPNVNKVDEIVALHRDRYKIPTFKVNVEKEFLPFDYQYFRDQRIIAKWFTSPTGEKLTWMEIIDDISVIDPTHASWTRLWDLCIENHKEEEPQIENILNDIIPWERQYRYEER